MASGHGWCEEWMEKEWIEKEWRIERVKKKRAC